ncbi:hypothetical protein [Flammeovirga sp. SJP92]|uniref:hypothetical protein n=1 Tax=Flammeovirga sp. SJP92 TaxID=1775430 RepID=UPI000786D236|nr:hypothetical protein [Flammeovirga sp. SJP92]KXX66818.1 hypothetical protein AVL50_30255 [Flammeovirga sp. SJP92]
METFIRKTNDDIKTINIFCSFLAGVNLMAVVGFDVVFSSAIKYMVICGIGGALFLIVSLRKKYFYLDKILIEDGNIVFKTRILFLTHKTICQVENITITRTYYSLVLRCYKPDRSYETRKFKLSSSNWKNLDSLERLIMNSKSGLR